MPQLLLEIFSEEIPARMQERAREGLEKAMAALLVDPPRQFEVPIEGFRARLGEL